MQRMLARCLPVLIFIALTCPGAHGAPAAPDNGTCLSCHGNPTLQPVTENRQGRPLLVSQTDYRKSVHRNMACRECHPGTDGLESFKQIPHAFKEGDASDCMACHPAFFREISDSFRQSHHFQKLGDKMSCRDCHDPHKMIKADVLRTGEPSIYEKNRACIECHTDLVGYRQLSGRGIETQDFSHGFLPFKEAHFTKVRCVRCHTPEEGADFHNILPRDQALADCTGCHSDGAPVALADPVSPASDTAGMFLGKDLFDDDSLVRKLAELPEAELGAAAFQKTDAAGFINQGRFADSYLVGGNRNTETDRWVLLLLFWILAAVVVHGLVRKIMSTRASREAAGEGHAQDIYPRSVRWVHWVNAVCAAALMATGISMHWGGGGLPFDLGVTLHHAAASLLVANYAVFIVLGLFTGSARSYVPSARNAGARVWRQIRFYLYGIFRGEAHPHRATRANRFNPLQKAIYLPLMYIVLPLMILTGLLMLFPQMTPETVLGHPGRWFTITLHYLLAMALVVFLITHLYLCTTGEKPGTFFKAMLFGERPPKKQSR